MNKIFPLCAVGSLFLHSVFFVGGKTLSAGNEIQRTSPVRIDIREAVPAENRTAAVSFSGKTAASDFTARNTDLSPETEAGFADSGGLFEVAGIRGNVSGGFPEQKGDRSAVQTSGGLPEGGSYPPPVYPEEARIGGIEGICILRISTDETGSITELELLQSSGSEILDRASIMTVKTKWNFPEGPKRRLIREFEYKLTR